MANKKETQAIVRLTPIGGAIQPWQAELAEAARADAASFSTGLARISFEGGHIWIDGAQAEGDSIMVLILAAVHEKAYYDTAFVKGVASVPACYGFHPTDRSKINPHPESTDIQHETCAGCQHNMFGTAVMGDGSLGRGKRCGDRIRAVAMAYTGRKQDLVQAEARAFSLPATSLKNWGQYVAKLAGYGTRYNAVVTEMSVRPAENSPFVVTFEAKGMLGESEYKMIQAQSTAAMDQLLQPYPAIAKDAQPSRGRARAKPAARQATRGGFKLKGQ